MLNFLAVSPCQVCPLDGPGGALGTQVTSLGHSSALANGAAGHCSSYGSRQLRRLRRVPALWRRGEVSSITSRQAPEHGLAASSPGPDSRIRAAIFSAQLMQTPARSIPQPVQLQLDLS